MIAWITADTKRMGAMIAALLLLVYSWPIDTDEGANVRAHLDQAFAIASTGTIAIDAFITPHANTPDWARGPDGRYFPAKAPGAAFAAVPVAWLLSAVERRLGVNPVDPQWLRRNALVINWLLNSVVSAFAMTLLFHLALALGVRPGAAAAGTLAIALGTAYYPYATVYYAHVPAANALIAAAFLVFRRASTVLTDVAAGILGGAAVAFDYPAIFGACAFGAALLYLRPRSIIAYAIGGLVPLLFLLWYHSAAFGNPFATAYSFQNPRFAGEGGRFIGLPRLDRFIALVLGPYRGFLFYSPVLLLGVAGIRLCFAAGEPVPPELRAMRRAFAAAATATLLAWLTLNASYFTWWGGYTAGPRFIIPALALFGPLVALGVQRTPWIGAALLSVSVLNYVMITSVLIMVRTSVTNPLWHEIYPRFVRADFTRSNVGIFLGLGAYLSVVIPIAAILAAVVVVMSAGMRDASANTASAPL